MFFQNQKLLVRPKPFADESPVGYILRLAEANSYESIYWLLHLFNLSAKGEKFKYAYGVCSLRTIAKMTDTDESLLSDICYKPAGISSHNLIGNYETFSQILPIFFIRLKEPKICPKCLDEISYCRKVWELAIVTACPSHKCLLVEKCPSCRKKIKWNRQKVSECRCGFDFRKSPVVSINENELSFVNQIYYLFGLNSEAAKNFPKHLSHLNLSELTSLLFLVMGQMRGRSDQVGKSLAKQLSNTELHREFNEALKVYEDFPNNFFAFLDLLKKVYSDKLNKSEKSLHLTTTRQVVFGGTIRAIFNRQTGKNFDFVRTAFDEYYTREKLMSLNVNPDHLANSASKFRNSHLTLNETKRMLKIGAVAIKTLMKSGTLKAVKGETINRKEFWLIEKESVLKCKTVLKDCISIPKIISEFGLQQPHIDSLIEHKLLNEIKGYYVSTTFSRVFSRREVDKIRRVFENALINSSKSETGKFLNSNKTSFLLGRLGIDFGTFVGLIAKGRIKPIGRSQKQGLLGFYYDEIQIKEFCEEKLNEFKIGTLSLSEAEKALNADRVLIRSLLSKNFLKQIDTGKGQFLKLRIDQKSIEQFKDQYVLSNELAVQFRTIPRFVNQMLKELKIFPVESSSSVHCFVYKRSDTLNIVLDKKNLNRTTTKLYSVIEVAELLNMNIEQLNLLVESGCLTPYIRSNRLSNKKIFFTETGIEKYKGMQIDGLKMLSTKAAAKYLNIGVTAFKSRYVETKKIIAVKLPNNSNRIFYLRSEIEKIRELELNTIRASEAAKVLGVNISCINKLTIAGDLTPISGPSVDGFQYNVYIRSDVENLRRKRQSFKEGQASIGKSTRFGKTSGNRYSKRKKAQLLGNNK